jgi:hypothetical protein
MRLTHIRSRHARRVSSVLAIVAAMTGATACDRADSPVGPPTATAVSDTTAASLAVRIAPAGLTLTVVLDDAMSRLVPALGSGPGTDALRNALAALRGDLLGDAAAVDRARLVAILATARAALERVPRAESNAPEVDALSLALEAVQPLVESGQR